MRNSIIFILFVFTLVFAQDKPSNYFASSSSSRGQQQQVSSFAVWNTTSNSWINVIPPNVAGTVNGIVAVGDGLLAYGSMTQVSGRDAAGLAYFDGKVWCAPEGVGLFNYTPNIYTTQFNNTPSGKSSAFAATVVGNDVYLYGDFNQIGLIRDGVAGFAKLTWSAGGIFSVSKIGNQGYNQIQNSLPCAFCQRTTQPVSGSKNKLLSHVINGNTYFVFQDNNPGDLWQWQVDTPAWIKITNQNTARNITTAVRDFDLNSGNIYVVGNFHNLNDPVANNQYLHIACSTNQGNTWTAVAATNPLPVANFGDLPVQTNNGIDLPALTGTGLTSIAVENTNSIYVAGGWRINERNITLDNLAGQLQTRVIRITGTTFTIVSERFAGSAFTGGSPNFFGPTIYRLVLSNSILYAFGDFTSYRQVVPTQGVRFGTRFTDVYKGAAQLSNGVWSPAFGGFLTTSFAGDASPASVFTSFSGNNVFFYGTFLSSYNILSGGVFAYGGDKKMNKDARWNAVLQNQRFATSQTYNDGISNEGTIYSLHITKKNDALIIGGQFDWIGSQRIGGIAAYNPISDTVQQIGGGIYQTNNNNAYFGDNTYNNRVGGIVYDIEEWNDRLIIGGIFQRNNSGNCVSNVAWNKFRINGAGWEAIDGGCDNNVNDLLVVGNILYITGSFQYCGLNPAGYRGGLYRGSIPTNRIARIDLGERNPSWRNLGVGLSSGAGRALAWRNGDLFVGGSFASAGGRIASNGIARWRGDHWEDVVARCRGDCDRAVNVLPYIGTTQSPDSSTRKPSSCVNLKNIRGRIYCIDGSKLAYFDSNTWYQAADFNVQVSGLQNSVITRNNTNDQFILVATTSSNGANGANFGAYDSNNIQYAPSHGGFSATPFALAEGSNLIVPKFIIALLILIFAFLF